MNAGTGTLTTSNNTSHIRSTGNITLIADNMTLNTTAQFGPSSGLANTVTFKQSTAARGICIGCATAGTVQLATAELANVKATNVTIGDTNAGQITLGAAWTPTADFANGGTLSLISGGLIALNAGLDTTTITNKPLVYMQGVGITQAASTTINAHTGNLTLNSGTGTITQGASDLLLSTGVITLIGDSMALATDVNSQIGGSALGAGTATNVILTQSTNGTTIGLAGGAGTLNLTQTELNTMRTTNARIGDNNAGLITIGTLSSGTTFIPSAGTGVLTLYSGNGISVQAAGGVTMKNLILRGAGTFDLTTNASNAITNLAASITSSKICGGR